MPSNEKNPLYRVKKYAVGALFISFCALTNAASGSPHEQAISDHEHLQIEIDKASRNELMASQSSLSETCLASPLPSSPKGEIITMDVERVSSVYRLDIWREDCVDNSGRNAVLLRATPVSGYPFVCGSSFYARQNGEEFDSIRFQEQIGNGFYCGAFDEPITLALNQWSIMDNFDDQESFELVYDNIFGDDVTVTIPASNQSPIYPITAYNVPNSVGGDQIAIHLINTGQSSATIQGTLYHQDGYALGDANTLITNSLAPNERLILTAKDIERVYNISPWTKRARLELLSSSANVDLLALVQTSNGTTTNLTCTNSRYAHNIPNELNNDQAFIRISNTTNDTIEVRGTLYHQEGYVLGEQDSIIIESLAPKSTHVLTAEKIRALVGADIWTKRARLEITSDTSQVEIMGLIRTSNVLTNMSCSSSSAVPNIPNENNSDSVFVRVTNTSDSSVELNAELISQDGAVLRAAQYIETLAEQETKVYSVEGLYEAFDIDDWARRARFNIVGDTSRLSILNLIRSPNDVLTNMSCTNNGSAYYIPNTSSEDQAFIRITNRAESQSTLRGTLYDDEGNTLGITNALLAPSLNENETVVLNAQSLKQLTGAREWSGLARLALTSSGGAIDVLSLLRNKNGTLTNLSCSAKKFGLNRISGQLLSQNILYQDSDTNNTDSELISNDTGATAQIVNNPFIIQGHANVAGAGSDGATKDSGDVLDIYFANFLEGETLQLEIADASTDNDLELYLYDVDGNLIDASLSISEFESLSIPEAGGYYFVVEASSGASNYFLSVSEGATTPNAFDLKLSNNFVVGDVIVKRKLSPIMSAAVQASQRRLNTLTPLSRELKDGVSLLSLGQDNSALTTTVSKLKAKTAYSSSSHNPQIGTMTDEQSEKLNTLIGIKLLQREQGIVWAEPNYIVQPMAVPNDPLYREQWHYPFINLPQAWDITTGSDDVVVAVIDSGVLLNHPDLSGNAIAGYDFVSTLSSAGDGDGIDNDPTDPGEPTQSGRSFHGTHVAGTIAARTNNGVGVSGVSWGASLMHLRALGLLGGTTFDINNAVRYAAGLDNVSGTTPPIKADIINASYSGTQYSQSAFETYQAARAQGVIVVAAAGNAGNNRLNYPASYDGVISVSAVNRQLNLANYSSYGQHVDIAAPGGETLYSVSNGVLSTWGKEVNGVNESSYTSIQGTSMASPHVAGVIALMKSVYPELTPTDVDNLSLSGELTYDIGEQGRDDFFGHGVIDAYRAVQAAQRLTNGGVATRPAFAQSSVNGVNFGVVLDSYSFNITNTGDDALTVQSIDTDVSWASVSEVRADVDGLGRYRISVNRENLPAGIYVGKVTIRTSVNEVTIYLRMSVSLSGVQQSPGLQYVILVDEMTGETVASTQARESNGALSYSFNAIPRGRYYIAAGTDADNDFLICDDGEICGAYPSRERVIVIDLDRDYHDIDFSILATESAVTSSKALSTLEGALEPHRR